MITGFKLVQGSRLLNGSTLCQSKSVITTFAPTSTLLPIVIDSAHPMLTPLKPQPLPILIDAPEEWVESMQRLFTPIRFENLSDLKPQFPPIEMVDLG